VSRAAAGAAAPAARPAREPARAPRRSPAPARHLRIVDPEARRRIRRHRWVARLAFAAVVGSVLLVVGIHVMMAEGQLELDRLEQRATGAQRQYEQRRLAYAEAATPEAIVTRAQQLGLVPGSQTRYLAVPGIVGTEPGDPNATGTVSSRAQDWGKVKSSLVAQP